MNKPTWLVLLPWEQDCVRWHGRVLTGNKRHWCPDWDDLPIDDSCEEIEACTCSPTEEDAA